jgi:hypothetical protein
MLVKKLFDEALRSVCSTYSIRVLFVFLKILYYNRYTLLTLQGVLGWLVWQIIIMILHKLLF